MMRIVLLLLLTTVSLVPAAAPPLRSPTGHGDRLRDSYFLQQAIQLGAEALADVRTRADWERKAPELRRQFLDMMGLWPLPPRTPLNATVVGTLDAPTFTVERLHFQSRPGLYVTGNLYVPKKRTGPCPAVLYVCGHAPVVVGGVPHGNKVAYQHHAIWFAENGYVCLVIDTLQLGELPGLHHGLYRFGMWWWPALGYTPAGVELWNAIRALDYLQSRPEVDGKRLGVTGRSGGGATSWWLGAADERVSCIIPVAGIADLRAHVSEGYPGRLADGVVAGHCDCMYLVNTYRWDYTLVMALCAPRPLMLGNTDNDDIFPVPGYRRMTDKIQRLYTLLGVPERFTILETAGPHKDLPPLRLGAFRWMNRWLRNDTSEVVDPDRPRFKPEQLRVFDRPPADSLNDIIHERFCTPARLELPTSAEVAKGWWAEKSVQLRRQLLDRCFRGWPANPPALQPRRAGELTRHGLRVRAVDFTSEQGWPLRLWLVQAEKASRPAEVLVAVCDEKEWQTWLADLGPDFADLLHEGGNPPPYPYPDWQPARLAQHRAALTAYNWAFAIVTPRGVGRTRWSELSRFDGRPVGHQIRRRFYLLGQTLEGQQIWDIRRAVQVLAAETPDVPLTLQASGISAALALYASLFEEAVTALELRDLPTSHRQGPSLLNVLKVLDLPQTVALALPRRITLRVNDKQAQAWNWPVQLQKLLGSDRLRIVP